MIPLIDKAREPVLFKVTVCGVLTVLKAVPGKVNDVLLTTAVAPLDWLVQPEFAVTFE